MRLTIGKRLFLALTAVSLLVLAVNAWVTRWSFQQSFLDYVDEQELTTLEARIETIAAIYERDGDWSRFEGDPRRWSELFRPGRDSLHRRPRPGGARERPDLGAGEPPPDIGRRVALLDADGRIVAGPPNTGELKILPITVDQAVVGSIGIAPLRSLTNRLDQEFATKQIRVIYGVALAALLFASIASAIVARQLTRPLRLMTTGAKSISGGDYDTRIKVHRDDELGELADEFNQLARTLDKNRTARKQWVSDIAHELRTPLAILRGELEAIHDGVRALDERAQASLLAEIQHLGKLVDELHELSVFDEEHRISTNDTIDVAAQLTALVATHKPRLATEDLTIRLDVAPREHFAVASDAAALERVWRNLVENSRRYTDRPGQIEISCRKHTDHVLVEFADSAPGVASEHLPRLFERLYRVDPSRNRLTGGSGLGLAIAKSIVEAHGGTITADVSPLGGLLIRISLPLARVEE